MMRILLLSFLLFAVPFSISAQRAFKPVKTALKAKNYKEVINQVAKLRTDSAHRAAPRLCIYNIEAYRGLNDEQNMKLYLKQNYDTVAFFSTTYHIVEEAVRLDSIEQALLKTEDKKPRQRGFVREQLQRYFPNLNAGARYFYKKKQFAVAMPYLRLCLDLPYSTPGQEARLSDKGYKANAGLYVASALNSKQYAEVHRYDSIALTDSTLRPTIIECLISTAEAENDTAAYRKWLQTGWEEYADKPLFFTRLADYYAKRGDHERVVAMAHKQLQKDSLDSSALLAECMSHLNLGNFDDCIKAGQNLLQVDTANVDALYYIGASYVAKALLVQLPDNALSQSYKKAHREKQEYLKQAEPYLEKYRSQAPQMQSRWAPMLYKVYLGLNRGSKFAEMEKFLK